MPFREKGSYWKPSDGSNYRPQSLWLYPWSRVDDSGDYFDAVSDPKCTEDEIRELAALVAGERGWELR